MSSLSGLVAIHDGGHTSDAYCVFHNTSHSLDMRSPFYRRSLGSLPSLFPLIFPGYSSLPGFKHVSGRVSENRRQVKFERS